MGLKKQEDTRTRVKVLVIEAHVDDAHCGCAATVYRHLKRGDIVQWHTFIGIGYQVPCGWPSDTLTKEYERAMAHIGVEDYHLHPHKVDRVDIYPEIRNEMFHIWHDFNPDIAYVPWRKSRHQDHRAIGDFVYQVSWRTHADVLAYPIMNDFAGFEPNVYSPIDEDAFIAKMDAISEYKSQFKLRSWFSLDLVASFMQTYTTFVNGDLEYVEPFEQVKRVIK